MTNEEYLQAVRDTLVAQQRMPSEPSYSQVMRMNNLKTLILVSSKSSASKNGVTRIDSTFKKRTSKASNLDAST